MTAAFGRLCVETISGNSDWAATLPAAFGRLCVETDFAANAYKSAQAAAFGRLCVETEIVIGDVVQNASRLRAAVC